MEDLQTILYLTHARINGTMLFTDFCTSPTNEFGRLLGLEKKMLEFSEKFLEFGRQNLKVFWGKLSILALKLHKIAVFLLRSGAFNN